MPSIRKPLTIDQKLIALYTDPIALHLANFVATELLGAQPGTDAYQSNATCFMLTLEARLHGNRLKADQSARVYNDWALRRELVMRATGVDMLSGTSPTKDSVRNWLSRFIPPAVDRSDRPDAAELYERLAHAADEHHEGLPTHLERLRDEFERLSMEFAREAGQFGGSRRKRKTRKRRNLVKLNDRNLCTADGTYISPFSKVSSYVDENGEHQWLGSRAEQGTPTAQALIHYSGKPHGPTEGVNHVAVLTRSKYGRIVLSIERALGGEVHGALHAMDRIAPMAEGGIRGLVYDRALNGWQIDYLLARQGILSIVEPTAAAKETPEWRDAKDTADRLLAQRRQTATVGEDACRPVATDTEAISQDAEKSRDRANSNVIAAVAQRILGSKYDSTHLKEAAEAGRPLGEGLRLGTAVYLDSRNKIVVKASTHLPFRTFRHGPNGCAHELHVDDGALWDTRWEWDESRGGVKVQVKDQRLECVAARTKDNPLHRDWNMLQSTYRFTCKDTGEIIEASFDHTPSGEWRPKGADARDASHHMQPLAACDSAWRKVFGRRNDSESWFSWLKNQLLEDQRATSLDLNHQFLDILNAAIISNSFTRHYWRLEEHL